MVNYKFLLSIQSKSCSNEDRLSDDKIMSKLTLKTIVHRTAYKVVEFLRQVSWM